MLYPDGTIAPFGYSVRVVPAEPGQSYAEALKALRASQTPIPEPVAGALSCPFCGSDGEERTYVGDVGTERLVRHQIRCRGCGAATRWCSTGGDALKAWASRHPPLDLIEGEE